MVLTAKHFAMLTQRVMGMEHATMTGSVIASLASDVVLMVVVVTVLITTMALRAISIVWTRTAMAGATAGQMVNARVILVLTQQQIAPHALPQLQISLIVAGLVAV
jgi:hypothetical protein